MMLEWRYSCLFFAVYGDGDDELGEEVNIMITIHFVTFLDHFDFIKKFITVYFTVLSCLYLTKNKTDH